MNRFAPTSKVFLSEEALLTLIGLPKTFIMFNIFIAYGHMTGQKHGKINIHR